MVLLIIVITAFFVISSSIDLDVRKEPCNELNMPHQWVYKGEPDSEYLVCSECGIMPSGQYEEG